MFNFFYKLKNNTRDTSSKKTIASISYQVDDNDKIFVDMSVEDYSERSMLALFSILDILYDKTSISKTIDILKENLIKNDQADWLDMLEKHISKYSVNRNNNVIKMYEDIINSQPCIKPSDIMK